mgnify:CR=1 FL=1
MTKVLVIGSGGREHALAWRLAKSEGVEKVWVAPGNAGTGADSRLENLPITDIEALRDWALENKIDLTVVGPEAPLSKGVVNVFRAAGLLIFGPTKEAAQLESSKDFAKAFMKRKGIPTAEYESFTDPQAAHEYVRAKGAPIVIKADGLAAGKGVVVAMTEDEAHNAIDDMLSGHKFGSAGARVVIEEFLEGEEASFIDGKNVLPLATSQDHKRLLDGDKGPNTGGMGAYSPAPCVTDEVYEKTMREIIEPTVRGMAEDGIVYTGFLYAGLMIGKDKEGKTTVKTLEFNCRMGDPETQPIMSRIKSGFAQTLAAAAAGDITKGGIEYDTRSALGVVLAARGYPEHPEKGAVITGLTEETDDAVIFHAGTSNDAQGNIVVSGGRVLCVVGLGDTLKQAHDAAYRTADQVHFDGVQKRRDIGYRAL